LDPYGTRVVSGSAIRIGGFSAIRDERGVQLSAGDHRRLAYLGSLVIRLGDAILFGPKRLFGNLREPRLPTVCTRCNLCIPCESYVYIGFGPELGSEQYF